MTTNGQDSVPTLEIKDDEDTIVASLRALQRAVLLHPESARALFHSLVMEGRLFAQTRDGAQWKERVMRSALLSRAQIVAQSATFWLLEEERSSATPSAMVEAIAAAASASGRDDLLDRLLRKLDGVIRD